MWGIPSLTLDICSLCQLLEDRPKSAGAARRTSNTTKKVQQQKLQQLQQQRHHRLELDTDSVVIGNGPAGIALSALLSGWQPFYNRRHPHPDPQLHEQLLRMAADDDQSLLAQDLCSLADQHFAHSETTATGPGGHTPFAVLYDCLTRPHLTFPDHAEHDAFVDANDDDGTKRREATATASPSSSCLCWRRHESAASSHIVLGDQHIGGSWMAYDDDMVTVSAAEWMDLPGYSLAADFMGDPSLAKARPRAGLYKAYLMAYVAVMGLQHNFRPFTKVTQIEKYCHPLTGEHFWQVRGVETAQKTGEQRPFVLRCRHVVLACGQQQPKLLGVPGELATDGRIVYSLSSLKQLLETDDDATTTATRTTTMAEAQVSADCPVVVVGDGISAADAVLHCLSNEQPVLHVVRRTERELRNIQLARLSPAVYPEYARVFRLLSGRTREVNYRRLLGTSVRTIGAPSIAPTTTTNATITATAVAAVAGSTTGGAVLLLSTTEHQQRGRQQDMTMQQQQHHQQQQQQQLREQSFRALAVCIGRRSDLPLLKEYLSNTDFTYEFNTRYQSVTDPALFAVGAMAGDHFVRYLVGGALCVAQTIINGGRQQQQRQKRHHQQQRVQDVHPATEVLPLSERGEDADRKRQVHRRLRDRLGTGCAILRTATAASTAANPLVATTAAVATAKQFIGRAKSQLQLKTTTVV
uniref:Uncharacterized protein n=1 Tax=Globodera rostochiensis TaxID=31243 RepID=A0A914I8K3_GLORO